MAYRRRSPSRARRQRTSSQIVPVTGATYSDNQPHGPINVRLSFPHPLQPVLWSGIARISKTNSSCSLLLIFNGNFLPPSSTQLYIPHPTYKTNRHLRRIRLATCTRAYPLPRPLPLQNKYSTVQVRVCHVMSCRTENDSSPREAFCLFLRFVIRGFVSTVSA